MRLRGRNSLSIFATSLSFLLLSGVYAARPPTQFKRANAVHEFGVSKSSGRVMQQIAVGSEVADEDEAAETECQEARLGADLDIMEGEVLTTLNTSSIALCCGECQSMDACTTYRRNRSSGSCELISAERVEFETNSSSDFDIGGFLQPRVGPRSIPGPSPSPDPECRISQGITYPNGNILTQGDGHSARHCCEVCRSSTDCYSWYFDNRNRRCTINSNVPVQVRASSSRFSGGTVLN